MDRRAFLRRTAVVSSSLFVATAFPTLAAAQPGSAPLTAAPAAEGAQTVAAALAQLLQAVGATTVRDAASSWRELRRQHGATTARLLDREGFQRVHRPLYRTPNQLYMYAATGAQQDNACAVWLDPTATAAAPGLLAGPAIVGLARLAHDLIARHPTSTPGALADALLPTRGGPAAIWHFGRSSWASYQTRLGQIRLSYTAQTPGQGRIRVVVTGAAGGDLAKEYPIAYTV